MCRRGWAAETPDKHERELKYLTHTFAKPNFPETKKLMNGALVTPTPGQNVGEYITLPAMSRGPFY